MQIIGLGHYSRCGKDTFANYFLDYMPGALKIPFAWKLKQITHELYAWAGLREPEYYETPEGALARDIVLPALGLTPVQVWVKFGTPAVREQVYDRTWIDYVLKTKHNAEVLVIPDVRFPNECEAIKSVGGTLIKIVRPGYGPRNTVADRALIGFNGWDYIIGAEGTMESLNMWARMFADCYKHNEYYVQSASSRQQALSVEIL